MGVKSDFLHKVYKAFPFIKKKKKKVLTDLKNAIFN